MEELQKLRLKLKKVEKELDTCRTSVLQDGWQTQRHAKKARKWDILAPVRMKLLQRIDELEQEQYIEFEGFKYWYDYRLAKDRIDICLATKDPKKYCNGFYRYSTKDPGNGKAFVLVKTDNTNMIELYDL